MDVRTRGLLIILGYFMRISSSSYCSQHEQFDKMRTFSLKDFHDYGEISPESFELVGIRTNCDRVVWPITISGEKKSCIKCWQSLEIEHSNLTIVPSSTFVNFPFLTAIDMKDQNIQQVVPGAFNSLNYSLKHVNLAGNMITKISVGIFNSLYNLESVDISRNAISLIEEHSLSGLIKLRLLNISHNYLTVFGDSILDRGITELNFLDLSFNNISTFETLATNNIEEINLTNNMLHTINFCPPHQLIKLSLSYNRIMSLKNDNCSHRFSNLRDLDLSFNYISDLDSVFFIEPINNLKKLSIAHNNISIIPTGFFSTLNHLVNLNLSYNVLEQFQHGTFEALDQLRILDISHNNLKEIKRYFHSLTHLQKLFINNNKIVYLNSEQLFKDLPQLSRLSITNNNLTCENLINLKEESRKLYLNLEFEFGGTKNTTNIHGISCIENEDSENTENLQQLNTFTFNNTLLFNYFDKDFKNTNFFKYLESLKTVKDSSNGFNNSINNYFNSEFKNSNFVKYMDEFKKADDLFNVSFTKSVMYNFFNKDFENSKFYKYLMSLQKTPQSFKTDVIGSQNYSRYGKLIYNDSPESSNSSDDTIFLSMILIILIIICITSMLKTYLEWKNSNKMFGYSNQVEMIEA